MSLKNASRLIKKVRVSVGGINQTVVDVRLVVRVLMETGATQFVAVHNHPSGNITPSKEDISITNNLKEIGKNYNWLKKQTDKFNIKPEDALIVTLDGKGQIFCQAKNK